MTSHHEDDYAIYIDESGDLGFGPLSSQYFVMVALVVRIQDVALVKRLVRKFRTGIHLPPKVELKAYRTKLNLRNEFRHRLASLPCWLHYVVVNKRNVVTRLRCDTNILYNYVAGLLLAPVMSTMRTAHLNVDCRTIKVSSGNSLSDYLRVKLWYEMNSSVNVVFRWLDSRECLGIQAADIACNAIFRSYENGDNSGMNKLASLVKGRHELFFFTRGNKKSDTL